jgi:hypothetical protein
MTDPSNAHAGWFRDVRAILKAVEAASPGPQGSRGLPLPQISSTLAAFNFTNIPHAEDARLMVAVAETILSYALVVEFDPRPVPASGSTGHYVLSAYMPSGLRVDIVARAGIFGGAPELAVTGAAA